MRVFIGLVALAGTAWLSSSGAAQTTDAKVRPAAAAAVIFHPAAQCMTCHNGLMAPSGEDISFGTLWRPSMMANAARDPYWHAGVRREVTDHPDAQAEIENECSRCHMPMAHVQAQVLSQHQAVFANLPPPGAPAPDPMAIEGVSCAVCHQISASRLGEPSSFSGGFAVDTTTPLDRRQIFGPYDVDKGRVAVMRSATGFEPTAAPHVQQSEICATCHTLYTHSLDDAGPAPGEFPEQMPYQEWLHSEFRTSQSCQSCHMPVVAGETPITSVLGQPRDAVSRHDFRGANFLMLGILNRFRGDLGVATPPAELDAAVLRAKDFLQSKAATLSVEGLQVIDGRVEADLIVRNLGGHKLPTAYPSRRVWLFVTVADAAGRIVFSSGQPQPNGSIAGNDNDRDGATFEPHYRLVRAAEQVQIYETIMGTHTGVPTTGLLSAFSYIKDNRLLPRGFDKDTARDDVAVRGDARGDADFAGGGDRVRYSIDVAGAEGPFTVDARLMYQSIAYRWAENLRAYAAAEPARFVAYYEAVAPQSTLVLARTTATSGAPR